MIDNTTQQTLDFIQYSSIFGELDSDSGEKSALETPPHNQAGMAAENAPQTHFNAPTIDFSGGA